MTVVGKAVPHESAWGHATGQALYTDDVAERQPGTLHAWPVMAPHAHARVVSVDTSSALRAPGVAHVLTQDDVRGEGDTGANRHDEPLFPCEVLFHGQPVAWVIAETVDLARSASALVAVA
ncbi:MAG TPA: hypothetical protein VF488_02600, partial [Gemmatimonadaceae bacterium]